MKKRNVAAAIGAAGVAEFLISAYFYRRTMVRSEAKVERTMKMAGTDWSQYADFLAERKERFLAWPHEDVWVTSDDGLKLHGTFFENRDNKQVVICCHGYTSEGMKDYIALSDYYLKHNFAMLLVDLRAHGQSEGKYIGFGCTDRMDVLKWIEWVQKECGEDAKILLHGTSMGAAFAPRAGQGHCGRLWVYLTEGSVYPCAAFHVPFAGIPDHSDCRPDEPEACRLRHG